MHYCEDVKNDRVKTPKTKNIEKKKEIEDKQEIEPKITKEPEKPSKPKKQHHIKTDDKPQSHMPTYKNELEMYNKSLREALEIFRRERARRTHISEETKITNLSKEGPIETVSPAVYSGRCALLRKMGFKTTRLRTHHKTLRPFKYYTFNHKVYESSDEEESERGKKKSKKIVPSEDVDVKPLARILERFKNSLYPRSKLDDDVEDVAHKADAATAVLEKFRSEKRRRKVLEPCRCEDGKEVTFIIKGVCLCDKTKTKNFLTKDTCGEYCKSKLEKASEKTLPPVPEKAQEKEEEKIPETEPETEPEPEVFEPPEPPIYEPEVVKTPPKPDSKKILDKYCDDNNKVPTLSKYKIKQNELSPQKLHLVDSKEIYRKQSRNKLEKKRKSLSGMMIDTNSWNDEVELQKKSSKSVTFKVEKREKTETKDDKSKRMGKEEKIRSEEQKEVESAKYDEGMPTKKQSSLVILYKNQYQTVESQSGLTEEQKKILETSEKSGTNENEPANDNQEVVKKDSIHSL